MSGRNFLNQLQNFLKNFQFFLFLFVNIIILISFILGDRLSTHMVAIFLPGIVTSLSKIIMGDYKQGKEMQSNKTNNYSKSSQ